MTSAVSSLKKFLGNLQTLSPKEQERPFPSLFQVGKTPDLLPKQLVQSPVSSESHCLSCLLRLISPCTEFSSRALWGVRLHTSLLSSCLILFVYLSHVTLRTSMFQLWQVLPIFSFFPFQYPWFLKGWPQKKTAIFYFPFSHWTQGVCTVSVQFWVAREFTTPSQHPSDALNRWINFVFSALLKRCWDVTVKLTEFMWVNSSCFRLSKGNPFLYAA